MANWSNPTLTSLYTDFVTEVKNRDVDLALGLDPATTSPTNVPANAIRWNSASFKYQKWDGSTWNDLSTKYIFTAVEVSGSTVPVNGMYLSTTNTLNFSTASTASRLTIDGSGNVNIDSGTFYVDAVNNRVGIGTTGPSYAFDVANPVIQVGNGTDAFVQYKSTAGNWHVGVTGGGAYNFYTGTYGTGAFRMSLDASGNLGLGVVPSAWGASFKVLDFAGASFGSNTAGTATFIAQNAYYDFAWKYKSSTNATLFQTDSGSFQWYTSTNTPSVNGAITFTQVMTLDASGNLGIKNTSPTSYNAAADDLVVGLSGDTGMTIVSGTANQGSIFFADGTTGGAQQAAGYLYYLHNNDSMGFGTANTLRMTLDASGNVNIDSGTFYVDAVNNRVGVGTTGPSSPLHVYSAGNTELLIGGTQTPILNLIGGAGTDPVIGYGLGALRFGTTTGAGAAGFSAKMTLDASGNLGLGVVPSAWGASFKVLDFAGASFGSNTAGTATFIAQNAYYDFAWKYKSSTNATLFQTDSGSFQWYTSTNTPSVNGAITFTQAMTLNASGSLLLGTTSSRGNFYNGSSGYDLYMQVESINYGAGCSYVRNSPDSASAVLIFGKTRSGSLGGNAIVANNDNIGTISFQGSDGSEFVPAAAITAHVDGTPGTNDMPGLLVFSTTADGAATPTERMSIGNAGVINTYTATGDSLNIRNAAAAGTATGLIYGLYSATSTSNGTVSFTVWSNGNVVNTNGSYGTISDAKLKENIVDANSQWDDIKSLQVRNYNFKEGQTHTQIGLVAQEVELISPGLVSESPDRDAEGNDLGTVTKSVNLSVLYMKAVKALQEAMERIETLEAKVAALEAR